MFARRFHARLMRQFFFQPLEPNSKNISPFKHTESDENNERDRFRKTWRTPRKFAKISHKSTAIYIGKPITSRWRSMHTNFRQKRSRSLTYHSEKICNVISRVFRNVPLSRTQTHSQNFHKKEISIWNSVLNDTALCLRPLLNVYNYATI